MQRDSPFTLCSTLMKAVVRPYRTVFEKIGQKIDQSIRPTYAPVQRVLPQLISETVWEVRESMNNIRSHMGRIITESIAEETNTGQSDGVYMKPACALQSSEVINNISVDPDASTPSCLEPEAGEDTIVGAEGLNIIPAEEPAVAEERAFTQPCIGPEIRTSGEETVVADDASTPACSSSEFIQDEIVELPLPVTIDTSETDAAVAAA